MTMSVTTAVARPTFRQLLRDPVLLVAFGFGSGLAPKAPGTAGSLVALFLVPLLSQTPLWGQCLVLGLAIGLGIPLCERAADRLGVADHPGIVWDEFAGLWLALIWLPQEWPWLVAGFGLFRLFDIGKPWPIRWLDRNLTGGLGIMLDDLAAGLCVFLLLTCARFVAT